MTESKHTNDSTNPAHSKNKHQAPSLGTSSPKFRWLTLSLLGLVGLGLSILLSVHFYEIRGAGTHFKSACNFGESINCDVVAASKSAELIAGIPLSSFAAGWFLTLFFISLFHYQPYWRREALRVTTGMHLIGGLIGLGYFWVMKTQLHTLCLYCLGVDLCLLLGLLISVSLRPDLSVQARFDRSKWSSFFFIGLSSHLVTILGLALLEQSSSRATEVKDLVDSILNTPPVYIPTEDGSPAIGPKDAPIKIVEFSDFQCPFCRMGALTVNSVLLRYPGRIRIVFKNFPFDQKCNPEIPQTMHPVACEASKAALCAHEQGQFEKAYETLFEMQHLLVEGGVARLLESPKLNLPRLLECIKSPQTALLIERDLNAGKTLGISGTPTFFVNGHRLEGNQPYSVWTQIIDRLIQP